MFFVFVFEVGYRFINIINSFLEPIVTFIFSSNLSSIFEDGADGADGYNLVASTQISLKSSLNLTQDTLLRN